MSNTITIELCTEDRARIDRLIEALERNACEKCVPEAVEASPQTPLIHKEEKPVQKEPAPTVPAKTVTHEELMAKVIELSAKDVRLKAQVRDIVLSYAPRVKAVPEDKLNECYEKLVALEG